MKLNKNSWHAKTYRTLFSDTLPNNLCHYFWVYLGCSFLLLAILIFAFGGIFIVLFTLPFCIVVDLCGGEENINIIPVSVMMYGVAIWWVFLWGLVRFCISDVKILERVVVPESVKIGVEFTKAKIGRYCPKIEWVKNG